MAELTGKAVSELPAATSIADSDLFVISASGASKKATAELMRTWLVRMRLYSTVVTLGFSYPDGATIAQVYAAMPTASMGVFVARSFTDTLPEGNNGSVNTEGTVVITKSAWDYGGSIMFYGAGSSSNAYTGGVYFMPIYKSGSVGVPSGTWHKVSVDSGWITATLESAFKAYNNAAGNSPQYRKIGDVVHLRGVIAPTAAITGSGTSTTIFTLPAGFRPAASKSFICQGSGKNTWLLAVGTNGAVGFSRYGTTEMIECGTNAWLPFDVCFAI